MDGIDNATACAAVAGHVRRIDQQNFCHVLNLICYDFQYSSDTAFFLANLGQTREIPDRVASETFASPDNLAKDVLVVNQALQPFGKAWLVN
jgi:hypothetical protein